MMTLIDQIKDPVEDIYKLVFKNENNDPLEVSYIRKNDGRDILCVPTQTSCNMSCSFCYLTSMNIKAENLSSSAIVKLVNASLEFQNPANPTLLISYMNAGEPLMNVQELIASMKSLINTPGYDKVIFGVSTIIPGRKPFYEFMNALIENNLPVKLHWSFHSTEGATRKSLMPSALNIQESLVLLQEFMDRTKQPVEIHYTLMHEINDRQVDLDNIVKMVDRRINFKLLRFAPHKDQPSLKQSDHVQTFAQKLRDSGFTVKIYSPPGRSINASCGQFILDQYTSSSMN